MPRTDGACRWAVSAGMGGEAMSREIRVERTGKAWAGMLPWAPKGWNGARCVREMYLALAPMGVHRYKLRVPPGQVERAGASGRGPIASAGIAGGIPVAAPLSEGPMLPP